MIARTLCPLLASSLLLALGMSVTEACLSSPPLPTTKLVFDSNRQSTGDAVKNYEIYTMNIDGTGMGLTQIITPAPSDYGSEYPVHQN